MSKDKNNLPTKQKLVKFLVTAPFIIVGIVVVLLCLIRNGTIAKELIPFEIPSTEVVSNTMEQLEDADSEEINEMIDDVNENHSTVDWVESIENMLTDMLTDFLASSPDL